MNLNEKVVVVTGAAQGLGRAMAIGLAQKGAHIALVDVNQERLDESKVLCEKAGGKAQTFTVNVADEEQVEALFSQVNTDMGGVHGLINNAGILRDGLLVKTKEGQIVDKMSLAQWQAVIDVNLTGVFLCGREASVKMIESGQGGVIVNISSISKAGNAGQSNYSAAKAGVAAMTTLWSKELARHNIRVSGIAPGFVKTDMVASMRPEVLEKMAQGIPVKRLCSPEEIAHAAVFLFENDYMSGRTLEIDGALRL